MADDTSHAYHAGWIMLLLFLGVVSILLVATYFGVCYVM